MLQNFRQADSDDGFLYHYTSLETACTHILQTKQLLLNCNGQLNLETAKVIVDDEKGELTVSFFQQPTQALVNQLHVGGLVRLGDADMTFKGACSENAVECAVAACTSKSTFML